MLMLLLWFLPNANGHVIIRETPRRHVEKYYRYDFGFPRPYYNFIPPHSYYQHPYRNYLTYPYHIHIYGDYGIYYYRKF